MFLQLTALTIDAWCVMHFVRDVEIIINKLAVTRKNNSHDEFFQKLLF